MWIRSIYTIATLVLLSLPANADEAVPLDWSHTVTVPISMGVELVGYDVPRSEAPRVAKSQTDLELVKGRIYTFVFFFRILEAGPMPASNLMFSIAGLPAATIPVHLSQTQIGAVERVAVEVRIPLGFHTETLPIFVGPDILKRKVGIGELTVTGHEVPESVIPDKDAESIPDNLIRNGDFEQNVDRWILYEPVPHGVYVSVDTQVVYDGKSSARIEFGGGTNPEVWRALHQTVRAKPSTDYELSYFLKTDDINTSCGVKLEVVDPDRMQNFIVGVEEFVTGTQDWSRLSYRFRTPDVTRLLTVRARRYACGPTYGTAWFDRIVLRERE